MASMLEISVPGCVARCLREKSARNRRARGAVSVVRVLRSARTVDSILRGASMGLVAEGAMLGLVVRGISSYDLGTPIRMESLYGKSLAGSKSLLKNRLPSGRWRTSIQATL